MSADLLDVNVLLALTWPNHVHHRAALQWFEVERSGEWATCPITESGFLRVSSNRRVIPYATTPMAAIAVLQRLRGTVGHVFWHDDVSLADSDGFEPNMLHGYRQVTDAHLLALAAHRQGRLVTFDRKVAPLARDPAAVVTLSL